MDQTHWKKLLITGKNIITENKKKIKKSFDKLLTFD